MIAGILEQVAVIGRELTAARQSPFGDVQLSKSQLDALFVLAHADAPVTSGALAGVLHVTPGAVTQLVAGLREHSLVETIAQPGDGRVRIIQLSPLAREQVGVFEREAVDRLAPQFSALDTDELAHLSALLRKRASAS